MGFDVTTGGALGAPAVEGVADATDALRGAVAGAHLGAGALGPLCAFVADALAEVGDAFAGSFGSAAATLGLLADGHRAAERAYVTGDGAAADAYRGVG